MNGPRVRIVLKTPRAPRASAALTPSTPKPSTPKRQRPNRAASQLALAHYVQRLVDDGVLADYADAARRLGLTRARLTQVQNLLHLAPEIQENVLTGKQAATERALRAVVGEANWEIQVAMFAPQSE